MQGRLPNTCTLEKDSGLTCFSLKMQLSEVDHEIGEVFQKLL